MYLFVSFICFFFPFHELFYLRAQEAHIVFLLFCFALLCFVFIDSCALENYNIKSNNRFVKYFICLHIYTVILFVLANFFFGSVRFLLFVFHSWINDVCILLLCRGVRFYFSRFIKHFIWTMLVFQYLR